MKQRTKMLVLAVSLFSATSLFAPSVDAQTDAGVAPVDAARPDYPRLQNESGDPWVCAARPVAHADDGLPITVIALGLVLGVIARRRTSRARLA